VSWERQIVGAAVALAIFGAFKSGAGNVAVGASTFETGFSPDDRSAINLVVKVIDSAADTLKMSAYSFTSPAIVQALIAAKRRGVRVQLLAMCPWDRMC
jgi:phosphatidylserine/phosphatidylglycerophosphate/cardiolipin synthase-like enzyme